METKCSIEPEPAPQHWRLRQSIGRYGSFVIVFGTITIPLLLSLLVVLWGGKRGDFAENSTPEWRYIILHGWNNEAVTLLSAGIQMSASLQALICTSLAASTILETVGVPISQLAEVSMMRGVNDGPWRLLYLSWTSSWRNSFALQPLLVLVLYLGTVATHFGSTLLLTDLELTSLLAQPNQTAVNMTVSTGSFNIRPTPEQWYMPPQYNIFGEVASGIDSRPTSQGLSDTGNSKRFFLPLLPANRTKTRNYKGPTYGWNNRVACVPPVVDGKFEAIDPGTGPFPFMLNAVGDISYEKSLTQAGMAVPPLCANGRCLPSSFNCSIVTTTVLSADGITLCIPGLNNVENVPTMTHLSDPRTDRMNANSMVILVMRTNGRYKDWDFLNNETSIPTNETTRRGEWSQWTLGPSQNVTFSLSMCFFSDLWETSQVEMSIAHDPVVAKPEMFPGGTIYDTTALRKQLGATTETYSVAERGLYTVDQGKTVNTTTHTNSTWWFDRSIFYQFGGTSIRTANNFTMFACTAGFGSASVNPYIDYAGVFEDVLLFTGGRAALALRAMLGIKAQFTYYNMLPALEVAEHAMVTESVLVQAPARWTGLLIYSAILALHFLSVVAITATFLLRTRYSKQGHFWHTISQVITDDTVAILQHAAESRDDHAMARTNTFNASMSSSSSSSASATRNSNNDRGNRGVSRKPSYKLEHDPVVVVSRSVKTGRVQVIRKDELGNV